MILKLISILGKETDCINHNIKISNHQTYHSVMPIYISGTEDFFLEDSDITCRDDNTSHDHQIYGSDLNKNHFINNCTFRGGVGQCVHYYSSYENGTTVKYPDIFFTENLTVKNCNFIETNCAIIIGNRHFSINVDGCNFKRTKPALSGGQQPVLAIWRGGIATISNCVFDCYDQTLLTGMNGAIGNYEDWEDITSKIIFKNNHIITIRECFFPTNTYTEYYIYDNVFEQVGVLIGKYDHELSYNIYRFVNNKFYWPGTAQEKFSIRNETVKILLKDNIFYSKTPVTGYFMYNAEYHPAQEVWINNYFKNFLNHEKISSSSNKRMINNIFEEDIDIDASI